MTTPQLIETRSSPGVKLKAAWSPSSLNKFIQCSLKYWFEKVARWESQPNEVLVSGRIVHGVLEDLLSEVPGERTREAARNSYTRRHQSVAANLDGVVDLGKVRERSGAALNSYFEMENPDDVSIVADGLEREVAGEVAGVPVEGSIDRLEYSETGLRIVDYKTGTPKPAHMASNWRQQMLYAAVSDRAIDDGKVTEVALYYLGEEPRLLVRPVTRFAHRKVSDTLRRVNEAREEYHAQSRWQASPGPLCRYCAFQVVCPAKRKRAPTPGSNESEARLAESPGLQKRERQSRGMSEPRSGDD